MRWTTEREAPSEGFAVGRVRRLFWTGLLRAVVFRWGRWAVVFGGLVGSVAFLRWRWRSTTFARPGVVCREEGMFGTVGFEVSDEVPEGGGLVEISN